MKISIIVPIYKVEKYLDRCINSILKQSYTNLEVILVDDGSPDRCGEICDKYAQIDKRIKVIHKKNGGLSSARNAGLRIASGDYISFVDSDDWIEPNMYQILLENAINFNADISVGGVRNLLEKGDEFILINTDSNLNDYIYSVDKHESIRKFLSESWAAWGKIYRKRIHKDILFPEGEINEDEAIALEVLTRCEKIVYTDEPLYNYIKRPNSITTTTFNRSKLDWYKHCKNNLEFVENKYPDLLNYAHERYIRSIMWSIRSMLFSKEDFQSEIKHFIKELKRHKKRIVNNNLIPFKEKLWIMVLTYGSFFNRGSLFKKLIYLNMKRYGGDFNG